MVMVIVMVIVIVMVMVIAIAPDPFYRFGGNMQGENRLTRGLGDAVTREKFFCIAN